MRVALILLFLLAIASVPGSLFPQRGTSPLKVNQYLRDHPSSGKLLDRFHLFDVFASPWFGAIYLLLFISLAGCVIPRAFEHGRELRGLPPVAPRNLNRLPGYSSWTSDAQADSLDAIAKTWSGWRLRQDSHWISAERGYARESGNLIFHLSLLVLLVAVGAGSAKGFKGTVIVREGSGFANNVTQYDTYTAGRLYNSSAMPPFSFKLENFSATYQADGMQIGAPRKFQADVLVKSNPKAAPRKFRIEVNEPLRIEGVTAYLVGHGYAPEFVIKDALGKVVWQDAAIFLPQDANFTSIGVVKIPDSVPQLGLQGFFLPTATKDFSRGPRSIFPAATDPQVFLSAWSGDLGLDAGIPQSVYRLETTAMTRIGIEELKPGKIWTLPNGQGSVEFTGFKEWASFSITKDPGKGWALGSAILAIAGLSMSLLIPRRRAWLRITEQPDGSSLFEVAGLSKTEAPGLLAELTGLVGKAKQHAAEVISAD